MPDFYKFSSALNAKAILVGLVLFVIVYWYWSFEGYYGYDDIKYSLFAFDLYNGECPSEDSIFSQRIGFYLPISFLFLLFGVHNISVMLWPLILTLTSLVFIYRLLRTQPMYGLVAGILFALNYYTIFFSNKIYPDVGVACLGFLSLYVLYKRDSAHASSLKSFIFVALTGWAVLCKESILYLFPFYLLVFINDVVVRKNYNFWKYTFLFGAISVFIFGALNYIFFQEIFHRSRLIADGHYSMGGYYDKPYSVLINRLTYEPAYMLIGSEMVIVLIFALPSLFEADYKKIYLVDSFMNFWSKSLLVILLMFWFSSTSYRYYNPMSLQPRMILLMIPSAALLGAFNIIKISFRHAVFFFVAFMICGLWQYYNNGPGYLIYIALSMACLALVFVKPEKYANLIKISVVLILFIHPLYSIAYNKVNTELTGDRPLMELIIEKKSEIKKQSRN